jgi:hypothetical protein
MFTRNMSLKFKREISLLRLCIPILQFILTFQGILLDFLETGNTSDIYIVFIAMGTTYFIQNEGFSLSFSIHYPFLRSRNLVVQLCLYFFLPLLLLSFLSLFYESCISKQFCIRELTL